MSGDDASTELPYVDLKKRSGPRPIDAALLVWQEDLDAWCARVSPEGVEVAFLEVRDDGDLAQLPGPASQQEGGAKIALAHRSPSGPPEDGVDRWLVLGESTPRARRWLDGAWREEPCLVAPSREAVFDRNAGLIESDALAGKRVAVIGLGSGGSMILGHLVRAGVGHFLLADRDRLEVHNIGRHVCGLQDLGRRKTRAMRDYVHARNPAAGVTLFEGDIVREREAFLKQLEGYDVIVGATDNNASRWVLNRFAVERGVPLVFGRAYVRACGGDAVIVRAGGPCYACLFQGGGPEEEVSSERSGQAPAYADVEVAPEPGLAMDVAPIALFCARLVLAELTRGTDMKLATLAEDYEAALYLWGNRRDGQFAQWEPLGFQPGGLRVQRWYGMRSAIRPTCEVCQPEAFLASLQDLAPDG